MKRRRRENRRTVLKGSVSQILVNAGKPQEMKSPTAEVRGPRCSQEEELNRRTYVEGRRGRSTWERSC